MKKVKHAHGRVLALVSWLITLCFGLGVACSSRVSAPTNGFTLTILHNNDGESSLLPDGEERGIARFAAVAERAKVIARGDANGGTIFVSSGDNFLTGPIFRASVNDGIYYDALALDLLGYDAIDLGNHDFDFGPDILADFIAQFRYSPKLSYLSSNLDYSREPALQALFASSAIAKSTIVYEKGEKIGIIGATTEKLPYISSPRNVVVNAVLPAIQAEVAQLTSQGVNKIVLIAHLQSVFEDITLAGQISGVDVMVAGGGDELLANCTTVVNCGPILLPSDLEDTDGDGAPDALFGPYPLIATDADGKDVPVVTTAGHYGYLGRLVVEFDKKGNVVSWEGGPIRVVSTRFSDGVPENHRMQRTVVQPVEKFVAELASHDIATSQVDLDGIRNNVRIKETNEGNLIADAQLWQAQQLAPSFGVNIPRVAILNGGSIRHDSIIPAGNFTELDTFNMVPFPNFLTVVPNIPRSQFKEILENAVSRVEFTDGRFAQVAGFSFVWDQTGTPQVLNPDGTVATPGTRVTDVRLEDGTVIVSGGVVQAGPPIDIASAKFIARGGDQYPFRGAPFTVLGVSCQQALFYYITAPAIAGGLNGLIPQSKYPQRGEGRIVHVPGPKH